MERIRIQGPVPFWWRGEALAPGVEVDVSAEDARRLVDLERRAVRVAPASPEEITHADPAPATRDPVVRRRR